MNTHAAPRSIEELMRRASGLCGQSLEQVAALVGAEVPPDLRRAKGWIGTLLETVLGATAGSRAEPDFPDLGVEMKTIPVDENGRPRESTYVCTAPLDESIGSRWETSWVRRKLSCVLWMPIVGIKDVPVGERVVAPPLLWRPNESEERALREDWEEHSERILLGEVDQVDATHGEVLQLRPKAANASARTWTVGEEGDWVHANPRGFYLRTAFTEGVLQRHMDTKSNH